MTCQLQHAVWNALGMRITFCLHCRQSLVILTYLCREPQPQTPKPSTLNPTAKTDASVPAWHLPHSAPEQLAAGELAPPFIGLQKPRNFQLPFQELSHILSQDSPGRNALKPNATLNPKLPTLNPKPLNPKTKPNPLSPKLSTLNRD